MLTRRTVLSAIAGSMLVIALPRASRAAGDPILRLSEPDMPQRAAQDLDLAALDALPQTSFRTATPWHTGVVEFSGVLLSDVVGAFGTTARHVRMIALNDYVVEADTAELIEAGALLATRQNGKPMPISDKGPVFVVFPFDDRKELQHQSFYSRSVWQLTEIQFQS